MVKGHGMAQLCTVCNMSVNKIELSYNYTCCTCSQVSGSRDGRDMENDDETLKLVEI